MSFIRRSHHAAILVVSALSLSAQLFAQTPSQQTTEPPPVSHSTLPQIVRLSLVEGDVRIARGKQDQKLTGNTWEQAAANIPLQSGFSLATGPDGRAEIEFEDTSTLYLAPSSALSLADLTTKDGVPNTRMTLLSGTVTLHLDPKVPGEFYLLETPTHKINVRYGDINYSRVTSFLNGVQTTPMEKTNLVLNHVGRAVAPGVTYELTENSVAVRNAAPTPAFAAWDAWVADRVQLRAAAMKSVMHDAGLNSPVPGLADLAGKGTFVPCAPYGTCWEPDNGWVRQTSDTTQPIKPLPEPQSSTGSGSIAATAQAAPGPGLAPALLYDDLDDFPCSPERFWYNRLYAAFDPFSYYPYDWAVCHAGFWINRNHRYMWVAGTHKHHYCPVHWVKYQGKLGYVPMHPRDQRGQLPVNLRHGLYTLTDKPNHPVERVAVNDRSQPRVLDSTPKEFRSPAPPLLARADSPELAVHMMHEPSRISATASNRIVSTLSFNSHSDRFMLATRVTNGAHTQTFTEPMSGRGGHIAPPSSSGFRGGYAGGGGANHAGGFSGGGGSHSSSGAGSSGGHSGGGFSGGGGGGGHSGGGGGSSPGGSSSGGGGGGGSHH